MADKTANRFSYVFRLEALHRFRLDPANRADEAHIIERGESVVTDSRRISLELVELGLVRVVDL